MAITSPELDWSTYEKYVLGDYLKNGYTKGADGRAAWSNQLGLDLGGKYSTGIEGFDWTSFNQGKATGALDDSGMPVYASNANAGADRDAAIKRYLSDPNTVYSINTDRINADGSTKGGLTRSAVRYKRVGNKLVPIDQRDFTNSSDTTDFLTGLAAFGAVAGGGALLGAGEAGGAGAGAVAGGGEAAAAGGGAVAGSGGAAGGGLTLGGEAAAGAGAAAGGGGAVGGSGLTLGGATSGAGLTAAPGAGLTLAAPTGTGAGLSAGAAAGGAGAVAGGSTLPGWLTNGVTRQVGGRVLGAVLGGAAAGAAGGSGNVNSGNLQGVANTLGQLGIEQADIARALYRDAQGRITINDGIFSQIIQNALNQQNEQAGRSDQLWDSYLENFLPNAEKFGQAALNYDTAGRRAEAGAAARASVETEAAMQRAASQRALGRGGISLDSGRALAMDNASRFNATKLSTGADADARRKVEETGLNLNLQAANIGQGIVGTSQQQAGQSLQAGGLASSVTGAREATRNTTLQPSLSFYGGATSATGAQGNVLNGVANIDARNRESRNAGWAGLGEAAGTILTAPRDSVIGGAVDWLSGLSDPKSKTVHGKVSGKRALADLEDQPVKEWTYKRGLGDEGTHVGRMAGEGDPMGPDGMRRIDFISELGKHQAAIGELAREVRSLKTGRRSLADA